MSCTNLQYYNYNNLSSYLESMKINMPANYIRWLKDIINTKVGMFRYKNLPKGYTSEIVEKALLFNNFLCWYNSPKYGLVLCRYLTGSDFDLNWKPTKVNLLALNGKPIAYDVPYKDIILCRDNTMDIIPFITLNAWIGKIIETEQTLDIVLTVARLPLMVVGEKEETAQLKQLIKKTLGGHEPLIATAKGFGKKIEQFDIDLKIDPIKIREIIDWYKSRALSSVGIYTVDEKRERIVTAEVQANNDFDNFVYTEMKKEREDFVKQLNEKYQCNIELEEIYEINFKEEVKLKREETKAVEEEKAKAENLIEDRGDNNGREND